MEASVKSRGGFTLHHRGVGFTLVELIIVVAVISILVGIALPRLRGMIDEGNVMKSASELKSLQAAVESFYIHNDSVYPSVAAVPNWQADLTGAVPQLIGVALDDPFLAPGNVYNYGTSPNGFFYVIWSAGPDNAADIVGVDNAGAVANPDDDIFVSNGVSGSGGF